MIFELLGPLATSIVLCAAIASMQPTKATCREGFFMVDGVRTRELWGWPRGSYTCARPPIGGDDDVLTGKSTAREHDDAYHGRIHCTGGSNPIIVNARAVGCSR